MYAAAELLQRTYAEALVQQCQAHHIVNSAAAGYSLAACDLELAATRRDKTASASAAAFAANGVRSCCCCCLCVVCVYQIAG